MLAQRAMQRICTAATKEAAFFAYRVAIHRERAVEANDLQLVGDRALPGVGPFQNLRGREVVSGEDPVDDVSHLVEVLIDEVDALLIGRAFTKAVSNR